MADPAMLSQDGDMISGVTAAHGALPARRSLRVEALALPAALVLMALLLLPMFMAGPSHLTSDESLYLAEAYNIAEGKGFTYPSGDAITHRAPLFPLVLAPAVKAGGPDAAYAITKIIVAANVLLVMWLAWRLAGPVAGVVGGTAAAASAFLAELGTTLYLDPLQCAFLLLSLIALHWAIDSNRTLGFVASGICVGLAFLAKESAIQWAPLALVAVLMLPSTRNRSGLLGACAFTAAFAITVLPWFAWVYAASDELFLVGEPEPRTIAALGAGLLVLIALAAVACQPSIAARVTSRGTAVALALAIVAAWTGFILYGLTAYSTWPYPNDYLKTIPDYAIRVGSLVQPYIFIVATWIIVCVGAYRRDESSRLLVTAAVLFAPFSIFAANRWLQLRDALPLVYLSYVALGLGAAVAWNWLREKELERPLIAFGTAAALGLAAVYVVHGFMTFQRTSDREETARLQAGSWDSPYTDSVAAWMRAEIPDGAHVLTSRVYFSSLHVETGGKYQVHQLPTVRVSIDPAQAPPIQAQSNLFRWGESDLRPTAPGDTWLNLQQFAGKSYWVGLSQQELFEYIDDKGIDYVVLTGEDVAFSSNAYAWFLTGHPAFTLMRTIRGSGGDLMFGYAVDRSKLDVVDHPTMVSPADFAQLSAATGLSADGLSQLLGIDLLVTQHNGQLSAQELDGAMAGIEPKAVE